MPSSDATENERGLSVEDVAVAGATIGSRGLLCVDSIEVGEGGKSGA